MLSSTPGWIDEFCSFGDDIATELRAIRLELLSRVVVGMGSGVDSDW